MGRTAWIRQISYVTGAAFIYGVSINYERNVVVRRCKLLEFRRQIGSEWLQIVTLPSLLCECMLRSSTTSSLHDNRWSLMYYLIKLCLYHKLPSMILSFPDSNIPNKSDYDHVVINGDHLGEHNQCRSWLLWKITTKSKNKIVVPTSLFSFILCTVWILKCEKLNYREDELKWSK